MNEQEILCFADIQAEEVKWLWYPYIPYGKITILQGDPGCGKTMAVLSLAALLSKGENLPFEEAAREPISILYQTSEDGIADTIKPRLESAGANCTRIKIINEEKRALTFDDPRLEQSILQENARLLILDPLSAYIGPNLIVMKASNQITLSQFVEQSNEISVQQQRVNKEKAELLTKQGDHKALDMDAIEASLCEAVDFTDGMVSEWFIQNFVRRITPIDDTRFAWVLDLAPEPQTLVCEVNGRKEYPRITLESNLYRGAWPPPGASRQTFLINRKGRVNGDISVEGLEHDRLPSRTPASKRSVMHHRI